jgi:hypothetical protein
MMQRCHTDDAGVLINLVECAHGASFKPDAAEPVAAEAAPDCPSGSDEALMTKPVQHWLGGGTCCSQKALMASAWVGVREASSLCSHYGEAPGFPAAGDGSWAKVFVFIDRAASR